MPITKYLTPEEKYLIGELLRDYAKKLCTVCAPVDYFDLSNLPKQQFLAHRGATFDNFCCGAYEWATFCFEKLKIAEKSSAGGSHQMLHNADEIPLIIKNMHNISQDMLGEVLCSYLSCITQNDCVWSDNLSQTTINAFVTAGFVISDGNSLIWTTKMEPYLLRVWNEFDPNDADSVLKGVY